MKGVRGTPELNLPRHSASQFRCHRSPTAVEYFQFDHQGPYLAR